MLLYEMIERGNYDVGVPRGTHQCKRPPYPLSCEPDRRSNFHHVFLKNVPGSLMPLVFMTDVVLHRQFESVRLVFERFEDERKSMNPP